MLMVLPNRSVRGIDGGAPNGEIVMNRLRDFQRAGRDDKTTPPLSSLRLCDVASQSAFSC